MEKYPGVIVKRNDDEELIEVFYLGRLVFTWYDGMAIESPEDLFWSRQISEIFFEGVDLGKKMGDKE